MLITAYEVGLRASEAAGTRVADTDSRRMVIRSEQDKGRRDRDVMLPPVPLGAMRSCLKMAGAGALAVSGP
jgi:integrase